MSETVIKIEGLAKQYRLGDVSTGTLSHDLNRLWHRLRGKEDPYLKIGEINDRTQKGKSDYVWALQDINFEVKKGEVIGVIGRNGAGKSTLLKILSKVIQPTLGTVKIKGRIASLLEVGTGFHPELSGRENIFLNGAILGMRKREIKNKLDGIIDFAGVDRFIDTPVKRYSSGMYVRLAFAVAAFLDPDILIIDEVLAVGDAEFQKKCLGKMKDVSINEGRTVLFVSHNLGAIKALCKSGILLENGTMKTLGNLDHVINSYFKKDGDAIGTFTSGKFSNWEKVTITQAVIRNQDNVITESFNIGDDLIIDLRLFSEEKYVSPNFSIAINWNLGAITAANTLVDGADSGILEKGENSLRIIFRKLPLLPQEYYLRIAIRNADGKTALMVSKEIGHFAIVTRMKDIGIDNRLAEEAAQDSASPFIPYEWHFENGTIKSFNILDNVKR